MSVASATAATGSSVSLWNCSQRLNAFHGVSCLDIQAACFRCNFWMRSTAQNFSSRHVLQVIEFACQNYILCGAKSEATT